MDPDDLIPTDEQHIRSIHHFVFGTDPRTGKRKPMLVRVESHSLTDAGSPASSYYTVPQVYDCGHSLEMSFGGQCFEAGCGGISCQECMSVCFRCNKPICPRHKNARQVPEKGEQQFCNRCSESLTRRRVAGFFGRLLVAPFVERVDGEGSRG